MYKTIYLHLVEALAHSAIRNRQTGSRVIARLYTPERLERGGPCQRFKLRQMETQRVHVKGVLPW
jgi:hypothetical protein